MNRRISRRYYPTLAVSGYSETDLLAFRDAGVISENEGERYIYTHTQESACRRSKIPINHSTVECYSHFSTLRSERSTLAERTFRHFADEGEIETPRTQEGSSFPAKLAFRATRLAKVAEERLGFPLSRNETMVRYLRSPHAGQ